MPGEGGPEQKTTHKSEPEIGEKEWKRDAPEQREWPKMRFCEWTSKARVSFLQFLETGECPGQSPGTPGTKAKGANVRPRRRRGGRQWLGSQPTRGPQPTVLAKNPCIVEFPWNDAINWWSCRAIQLWGSTLPLMGLQNSCSDLPRSSQYPVSSPG